MGAIAEKHSKKEKVAPFAAGFFFQRTAVRTLSLSFSSGLLLWASEGENTESRSYLAAGGGGRNLAIFKAGEGRPTDKRTGAPAHWIFGRAVLPRRGLNIKHVPEWKVIASIRTDRDRRNVLRTYFFSCGLRTTTVQSEGGCPCYHRVAQL